MFRKLLLSCGILSSLYYTALNIYVPLQDKNYDIASQVVSELSAIDAPTRTLWVSLGMIFILLYAAFGWGVLKSAGGNRRLRIAGILILIYSAINLYWPPMHMRGYEMTLTDILHIVWAGLAQIGMLLIMGFAAAGLGKGFRWYTGFTWLIFLVFGVLTAMDAPKIASNEPAPMIGIWERINMGAFFLWLIVFSIILLRMEKQNYPAPAIDVAHDRKFAGKRSLA